MRLRHSEDRPMYLYLDMEDAEHLLLILGEAHVHLPMSDECDELTERLVNMLHKQLNHD